MTKSFGGATPAPDPPNAPPPYTPAAGIGGKRVPPPIPSGKPRPKAPTPQPVYVVALYDFEAQAEGDLSFNAGDHIRMCNPFYHSG